MDVEQSRRAMQLFKAAVDLPSHAREELLNRSCGSDDVLRRKVLAMLDAHRDAEGFLDQPALTAEMLPTSTMVGKQIGSYLIEEPIASGGMGTVYLARQREPDRRVALKMMRSGLTGGDVFQRFQYESRVLARLHHPNVAQVYEAGMLELEADSGVKIPWFAMEYIERAMNIVDYAEARELRTHERLQLFIPVCEAIQHGHQRGIVHRDLKPSNILVDRHGRPRVIDFGVAFTTDADVALTTVGTDIGQLVGTLQYMSPEQCRADPTALDARTDVYSLGVVLYQLLTNRLPYEIGRKPVFEAARLIREQAPEKLSTHNRMLRGDIETITLKALEKDRDRRYASVADLRRDIQRYLALKPIKARPPSVSYRVRMFALRHRAMAAAVVTITWALILTTAISLWFAVKANRAEKIAVTERAAMAQESYFASMAAAESGWLGNEYRALRLHLDRAPNEHRGWEWDFLNSKVELSEQLIDTGDDVYSMAFNGRGHLVVGNQNGTLSIWDVDRQHELNRIQAHDGRVTSVVYDGNRKQLVTGGWKGDIRLWDANQLTSKGELDRADSGFRLLRLAPHGDSLFAVTGKRGGRLERWNLESGQRIAETEIPNLTVWTLAVSHNGKYVATGQLDGSVHVFDAESLEVKVKLKQLALRIHGVAFTKDETKVVTGHTGHVQVWDIESGELLSTLKQQGRAVAIESPDPDTLVIGWANAIRVFDIASSQEIRTLVTDSAVLNLEQCPDGRRLFAGTARGTCSAWDIDPVPDLDRLDGHQAEVNVIAFSPNGEYVASISPNPGAVVRLWDARTTNLLAAIDAGRYGVYGIAFSPDGSLLAQATGAGFVIRDVATGSIIQSQRVGRLMWSIRFSDDGRWLFLGGEQKTVFVWDMEENELEQKLEGHTGQIYAMRARGRWLATGGHDGEIRIWDRENNYQSTSLLGHRGNITTLRFDQNEKRLFSAGRDSRIRYWDLETKELIRESPRHGDGVTSICLHPDGTRMASVRWYGAIAMWDTHSLQPTATLHVKRAMTPSQLDFDPTGQKLVIGCVEGGIEIWDRRSSFERRAERRAALARQSSVAPRVAELLATYEPIDVAGKLREDVSLDEPTRRAALKVLLRMSHLRD